MPPVKKRRQEANKQQLGQLVNLLLRADKLGMFRAPVTEAEAPGYHTAIKHPMDLSTVTKKINDGRYSTSDEALSDVRLMLTNALEYNMKGDPYYESARSMRGKLQSLAKQCGIENDNSDSDDEFVPQGHTADNEKTLAREEKRRREDIHKTLQTMEQELEIPLDQLREKYKKAAMPVSGDGEAYSASSSGTSTSSSSSEGSSNVEDSESVDEDEDDEEEDSDNSQDS